MLEGKDEAHLDSGDTIERAKEQTSQAPEAKQANRDKSPEREQRARHRQVFEICKTYIAALQWLL